MSSVPAAPDSAVFDALAAPRRREILRLVWEGERSAGDVHRSLSDVSFGAVSQHLRILETAGLVSRRDDGRFHYYAARRRDLGPLAQWLDAMWRGALTNLKTLTESEEERLRPRRRRKDRRRRS